MVEAEIAVRVNDNQQKIASDCLFWRKEGDLQQSKALEDLFLNVDLFSFVTFVRPCFASTDSGSLFALAASGL